MPGPPRGRFGPARQGRAQPGGRDPSTSATIESRTWHSPHLRRRRRRRSGSRSLAPLLLDRTRSQRARPEDERRSLWQSCSRARDRNVRRRQVDRTQNPGRPWLRGDRQPAPLAAFGAGPGAGRERAAGARSRSASIRGRGGSISATSSAISSRYLARANVVRSRYSFSTARPRCCAGASARLAAHTHWRTMILSMREFGASSARCSAGSATGRTLPSTPAGFPSAICAASSPARFGPEAGRAPAIFVLSFAYSRGVPPDADFVFDARFLTNPHHVPALRPLTGAGARGPHATCGMTRLMARSSKA